MNLDHLNFVYYDYECFMTIFVKHISKELIYLLHLIKLSKRLILSTSMFSILSIFCPSSLSLFTNLFYILSTCLFQFFISILLYFITFSLRSFLNFSFSPTYTLQYICMYVLISPYYNFQISRHSYGFLALNFQFLFEYFATKLYGNKIYSPDFFIYLQIVSNEFLRLVSNCAFCVVIQMLRCSATIWHLCKMTALKLSILYLPSFCGILLIRLKK